MNINSEDYIGKYILAIQGGIGNNEQGFIIMAGDNPDLDNSRYLAFAIRGDEIGEYRVTELFNDSLKQVVAIYIPDTTEKYFATDGFVEITNINIEKSQISGVFEFTMKDINGNILTIKNGKFENVLYVIVDDIMSEFTQFEE